MQAAREGGLSVRVRFPLDDIDAVFQDRSGLEANGEVLLTDRDGHPLTRARYAIAAGQRVLGASMAPCLAGSVGQAFGPDYHGAPAISGFRPAPIVGGGCIVANLQYADALVPIHRLGEWFIFASIGFILAGAVISLVVARAVPRSRSLRLAASARALEAGEFEQRAPVAGRVGSSTAWAGAVEACLPQSVGDLVRREHEGAADEAEAAGSARRTISLRWFLTNCERRSTRSSGGRRSC